MRLPDHHHRARSADLWSWCSLMLILCIGLLIGFIVVKALDWSFFSYYDQNFLLSIVMFMTPFTASIASITLIYSLRARQVYRNQNNPEWAQFFERLIPISLWAFIISILILNMLPHFLRARAQGGLSPCKSTLKNLGTAMEMYSADNRARYPDKLQQITPVYLKSIPTCGETRLKSYVYIHSDDHYAYTIYCRGPMRHLEPGFPQYDSYRGLIDHR